MAKAMIDQAIQISKENNKTSIQLDIRETQSAAIQLFESKGFVKWGENPFRKQKTEQKQSSKEQQYVEVKTP